MKDPMGDRFKEYEETSNTRLIRRVPVIIRVDGRAFHTLLAKAEKPFDRSVFNAMGEVAKALLKEIQGAELAYFQSDECSVLVTDWARFSTQSWFDYRVQKMASMAGAIASVAFNGAYKSEKTALFDARCFNVPTHDVNNYFLWRQRDATRNSIMGCGQHYIGQKKIHGLNTDQVQDELWKQAGMNWNDLETWKKRGACALVTSDPSNKRTNYAIDLEIPIFSQSHDYIESRLHKPFWREDEND